MSGVPPLGIAENQNFSRPQRHSNGGSSCRMIDARENR
jgi:hypothetical protein